MRSVLLSFASVTVLFPMRAATAGGRDHAPGKPPSPLACVQALKQCGASLRIADDGRVLGVGMPATAKDVHLANLQGLPDVEQLYVASPKVTDEGLKFVQHLKQLRTLNLNATGVTDAGMTRLAHLACLRSLYLEETGIADVGMAHLSRLPELRTLSLCGTRITDNGLQHVRKMTRLDVLDVPDTGVTADGLLRLRLDIPDLDVSANCGESKYAREKLKQLEATLKPEDGCVTSVRMETQRAVDEGLRLLWGLPGLKRLSLIGVTLTPEHITTLTKLEDVRKLELAVHEKITHQDHRRLRQAMHGADIAGWYVKPPSSQSTGESMRSVSLRVSSSNRVVSISRLPKELDGTVFQCSYFPGNRGTESIPVILLHDWTGSRRDFDPFAKKLQSHGCAVVVPELWPRVESSRLPRRTGDDETPSSWRQFVATSWGTWCAQLDAITTFIVDEHNKGALNASLLCFVTDGKAGFLASNWTAFWTQGPPVDPVSEEKLFDIKGIVSLSPRMPKGFGEPYLSYSIGDISAIPMMLVVGAQDKDHLRAAKELRTSLRRFYRPSRPRRSADDDSPPKEPEHPNVSLRSVQSGKQGAALVREHPSVVQQIMDFIDKSIKDAKKTSRWKIRITSTLDSAFENR